ncbi:MAG TPA: NUDIX domain-containing protein [Candidatus Paceibacterota bacterium]
MQKGIDYPGVSVVFFCHDGNGNYLLHKRSKNARDEQGRWDMGGGGLEFGDTVIEKLKEEIMEEFCAQVKKVEFLGYRDVHRKQNGAKTHWVALDFRVLIDPSTVRIGEPHKFDDLGWFKIEALPQPLHSQFAKALDQYKSRLI